MAEHSSGTVTDVTVTSYNIVAWTVTYTPAANVELVVVSDALVNSFPVVTHWNAALNPPVGGGAPRGGQQVGASDGIKIADYDPVAGKKSSGGDTFLNTNPTYATPAGFRYFYASDKYALFSDGTEGATAPSGPYASDAKVPGFERYMAENYSYIAVSDLRAIQRSDSSRARNGLPIAHRNHPTAFDTHAPATSQLQHGLPIFQLVHCFVVEYDDPAIDGSESSLASFLVPPMWSKTPEVKYPVLFNSFYDINGSTFGAPGNIFVSVLGALYTLDRRKAVGIFHNGGGAFATQSLQPSGGANVKKLFAKATDLLGIDRDEVVIAGGSRGGSSGLYYASNPVNNGFTARYVISENPQTYPGDTLDRFATPSYSLVHLGVVQATGVRKSWRAEWSDPTTGFSGAELAAFNMTGTEDFSDIDNFLACGSPGFVSQMAAEGTKVLLRLGTHDNTTCFAHMSQYIGGVGRLPESRCGSRSGIALDTGTQWTCRPASACCSTA